MLTQPEHDETQRLFANHGYTQPLRVAPLTSDDERIFVVAPNTLATLPVTLAAELQQALHRKVWIVGEGPAWADTKPLS